MPDGKMDINPEELKAQVPKMQDVNLGLNRLQTYIRDSKAQAGHFGQLPNSSPAGNFVRSSIDAMVQSLAAAQQYMSGIISATQGTAGMTTTNEAQTQQSFKNQAV